MVIILGGQPGAGKSELERIARKELGQNVVSCNADIFRDYHPEAEKIKAKHESYYPELTSEYAQAWNNGLRAYCEANRMNFILETTFSSGNLMNKTISELQDKGYRVEIKLMAVHPKLSLLGTHFRYEHMKLTENSGRLVGKEAHDNRYNLIAPTLYLVQNEGLYNKLQIYGRTLQNDPQSFIEGVSLLSTNPKNAVQIFQQEVDRKWSADLRLYFLQNLDKVIAMKQARNAPAHEISEFKKEMAAEYPSQKEMQELTGSIIYQQQQTDLLEKRVSGRLPIIDIAGTSFTVDLGRNELRETKNPGNVINFKELVFSESKDKYHCYYHIKKHRIFHPDKDITVIPKNVKLLEIPNKNALDPFAVASEKGAVVKEFIAKYPLQGTIMANLHPLSKSYLPQIVKENLIEKQRQQSESLNKGRDKNQGISM
ncbi:hypothetical protein HDC92_004791 [Pedobacter sp. AK017]|nr:hypothetical protein [Pedobacter sp. AK017]